MGEGRLGLTRVAIDVKDRLKIFMYVDSSCVIYRAYPFNSSSESMEVWLAVGGFTCALVCMDFEED